MSNNNNFLSHFLETSFGTIHIVDHGPASSQNIIFCMHGDGKRSSWLCWQSCMDPLAQAGYRMLAMDMPGYGKSTGKQHTFRSDPIPVILAVLDLLQISTLFAVMGRSVGGKSTFMFAHACGNRVKHLIVCHPVMPPLACMQVPHRVMISWAVDDVLGHPYSGPHGMSYFKKHLKRCERCVSWYEGDFQGEQHYYATKFVQEVLQFFK